MNILMRHDWESTDTEGHCLCCNHCGKEVVFGTEEYDLTVDSACPYQIGLLRAEDIISNLSNGDFYTLRNQANRFLDYTDNEVELFLFNNALTKEIFEQVREETEGVINLNNFFFIVNSVALQKMKTALV